MGEVKPILLCAQAMLAMTVSKTELELQDFICKTRKAANNSAGAGMGEQDFDFAQTDHLIKEDMYFLIVLGVRSCIKKWGKAWARLRTSLSLWLLRLSNRSLVPGETTTELFTVRKLSRKDRNFTRYHNYHMTNASFIFSKKIANIVLSSTVICPTKG